MLKINVDAGFGVSGPAVGFVARNGRGEIVWMWKGPVEASSVQEAELVGVHIATLLAKFRNHRSIIIEGDNQV